MMRLASVFLVATPSSRVDGSFIIIILLLIALIGAVFALIRGRRAVTSPAESDVSEKEEKPEADDAQIAFFVAEDGKIVRANKYSREYIGLSTGDDVLNYCADPGQYRLLLQIADGQKTASNAVLELRVRGGQHRAFLTCCTRSEEQEKEVAFWGLELPEEELNVPASAETERGNDANQAKSQLLADMSYEIRTPMNGIIGLTEILLGDKLTEQQERYVRDLKTSAESLLGIINNMLDISRISVGMLKLEPTDTNLYALLKSTAAMVSLSAQSKSLDFIDDIRLNSSEHVVIDDMRLKQVLLNLLTNAIKYTKEGYVKLTAKIEGGNIALSVRDTGIGIPEEELPLIFSVFEQPERKSRRVVAGSEFDLSITKSLVELMGGKIWAESVFGKGSTFYVTLPYTPGDSTMVEKEVRDAGYIFAPTAEVLLVDDIQSNLTVQAGVLRLFGIAADVALSGREAIDLVNAKDYDIVFMDYMMPEMDGIETMQAIRCMGEKYVKLPIIALTANAMNESKELLLATGMDDFLPKPIDKEQLKEILLKWLPPKKVESGVKGAPKPSRYSAVLAAASDIEGLDINLALSRISGMQDILEESIKLLAHALGERLTRMESLLANGEMRGFTIEINGLKGSFANIGATQNSEFATELELAARAGNILLCEQKFAVFKETMTDFAEQLKSIFPKTESGSKVRGDNELLKRNTREAIDCLTRFEAKEASKLLRETAAYTFDEKTDAALSDAISQIELFKYKNAIAELMEIIVK